MTQATGSKSKLLIGYQTDISTKATTGYVLPVNSSGLKASRTQNSAATITGNLNPVEPFDGNLSVAGQITVPVDSIAFWYLLKAAFGTQTDKTGTGPYTYEFKAGNDRPYLTFEVQFTDLGTPKYLQYVGCKINGLSFSAGDEGELVANFDVVGSDREIATASFDGAATDVGFARLKNNQLSLMENDIALTNGKMIDLNIAWNCDATQYVIGGNGILGSIPDGVMSVSGNLNTLFEDTVLLEKAVNGTQSSLELTFDGGTSSALVIRLPEIKYTPTDPGIEGPQGIALALPFTAYYESATEGTSVVAKLTSTEDHV